MLVSKHVPVLVLLAESRWYKKSREGKRWQGTVLYSAVPAMFPAFGIVPMFLKPLMQWLHIGSVVLIIGGFFFFRVVLIPLANRFPDADTLISSALKRFSGVVWCTLLTVLISGLYNVITFFRAARASVAAPIVSDYSLYILILGIKFFIVFLIFTLAIILTLPYPVFDVFQKKPSRWLNIIVVLGLIVIFLSAFLRRMG